MSKPLVHILHYGSIEKLSAPKLTGAAGLHVTTGLIIYENPSTSLRSAQGKKKAMVVDPGMICDFDGHVKKINELDLRLEDISHVLCTHFHQDHVQALAKYPNGAQVFHFGSSSLLGASEYGAKIYRDGFIEVPEIKYYLIGDAHTKKDTIYVIDSENDGVVAFVGDLIFSLFDNISKVMQKGLDNEASENPQRRYEEFKKWFYEHPEVSGFYLGHCNREVDRGDLEKYFEVWVEEL